MCVLLSLSLRQTQPDSGTGEPRPPAAGYHEDSIGQFVPYAPATVLVPALPLPHPRRHLQQP